VTLLFFDGVAPSLAREGHFRPRLSVMNQVFQVAPGASYQLREPRQGAGLLLEEKA
jgi:hypothetical protein